MRVKIGECGKDITMKDLTVFFHFLAENKLYPTWTDAIIYLNKLLRKVLIESLQQERPHSTSRSTSNRVTEHETL
jgi:hypothetical protein